MKIDCEVATAKQLWAKSDRREGLGAGRAFRILQKPRQVGTK
jgi:hypothetical protein